MVDFFISYNSADRQWAVWIAWQLESAGYTAIVQEWDFRPGSNFVQEMQKATEQAERTIAVLSPNYLQARFTHAEWQSAFSKDPDGTGGLLVPVRVKECDVSGLLPQIIYIDLTGLDEQEAKNRLLEGVKRGRMKPDMPPSFPAVPGSESSYPIDAPPLMLEVAESTKWKVSPSRLTNLPRREYFVGRTKQVEQILTILKPDSLDHIVTIEGIGGIGKSALALELGYRCLEQDYFSAVIWLSAKGRLLTVHGIRQEQPEIATLEDLYLEIGHVLGYPSIGTAGIQEQRRIVNTLLSKQKTLLIIDNLDALDEFDREQVLGALRRMPSTAKAIITSRKSVGEGHRIVLTGLTPGESLALLQLNAVRRDIILNSEQNESIISFTGGVPLAMLWAQGQLTFSEEPVGKILARIGTNPRIPLTEYCFQYGWGLIQDQPAMDVLIAIGLHPAPVTLDALSYIAHISDSEQFYKSIETLHKLSLIIRLQEFGRVDVLPLTRHFIRAQQTTQQEAFKKTEQRAVKYYATHVTHYGSYKNWRDYDHILADKDNILYSANLCYRDIQSILPLTAGAEIPAAVKESAEALLNLASNFGRILWQRGYWQARILLSEAALEAAKIVQNWFKVSTFSRNIAWAHFYQSNNEAAKVWAEESHRASEMTQQWKLIAAAKRTLGTVEIRLENYERAEHLLQNALELCEQHQDDDYALYSLGFIKNGLGDLHFQQGHYEKAEQWYRESILIWQTPERSDPNRHIPYGLIGLASVSLKRGMVTEAQKLFENALLMAQEFRRMEVVASAKIGLAEVHFSEGRIPEGITLAKDALNIFEEQGMSYEAVIAKQMLSRHGAAAD